MSNAPAHRKRRRISSDIWASIAAAISRDHSCISEANPKSPRIVPTVPNITWLGREPANGDAAR
jgi:hypothetical protein